MTKLKYYEILGVNKNASIDEIKKEYKKKMIKYHPDKNINLPDDIRNKHEEMCKEITNAYKKIMDNNNGDGNDTESFSDNINDMGFDVEEILDIVSNNNIMQFFGINIEDIVKDAMEQSGIFIYTDGGDTDGGKTDGGNTGVNQFTFQQYHPSNIHHLPFPSTFPFQFPFPIPFPFQFQFQPQPQPQHQPQHHQSSDIYQSENNNNTGTKTKKKPVKREFKKNISLKGDMLLVKVKFPKKYFTNRRETNINLKFNGKRHAIPIKLNEKNRSNIIIKKLAQKNKPIDTITINNIKELFTDFDCNKFNKIVIKTFLD